MSSLRDRILGSADLGERRAVRVPEWDADGEPCTVYVRMLTVRERDVWEARMTDSRAAGDSEEMIRNYRTRLSMLCVVDESGDRIFLDDDLDALGAKNWRALERIAVVALELNALRGDAMETAAKN